MSQVMVTIRFAGDPDDLFDKWERAVTLWEAEFETPAPATVVAKGEQGGLFIVTSSRAMTRIPTSGAISAARWKPLGSRTRSSSISMC